MYTGYVHTETFHFWIERETETHPAKFLCRDPEMINGGVMLIPRPSVSIPSWSGRKGSKYILASASAQILMMSVPARRWYFINSWHVKALNVSSPPWPWDATSTPKVPAGNLKWHKSEKSPPAAHLHLSAAQPGSPQIPCAPATRHAVFQQTHRNETLKGQQAERSSRVSCLKLIPSHRHV